MFFIAYVFIVNHFDSKLYWGETKNLLVLPFLLNGVEEGVLGAYSGEYAWGTLREIDELHLSWLFFMNVCVSLQHSDMSTVMSRNDVL